ALINIIAAVGGYDPRERAWWCRAALGTPGSPGQAVPGAAVPGAAVPGAAVLGALPSTAVHDHPDFSVIMRLSGDSERGLARSVGRWWLPWACLCGSGGQLGWRGLRGQGDGPAAVAAGWRGGGVRRRAGRGGGVGGLGGGRGVGGGGLAGEPCGAGLDGLEGVVAGGPEGELGVDEVAAVVQGAAEAGGELGEDGLDGGSALPVEGPALGGAQAGGHGLPAGEHGGGGAAVAGASGLAGFAGDGDVELLGDVGGEVGVAGVAGVEQGGAGRAGDAGLAQDAAGFGQEGFQGLDIDGAGVAGDGEDDLGPGGGQGLDVVQLVEAAFLQRHDLAGRVGGADPGPGAGGGGGGLPAGGLPGRAGLVQGLPGVLDLVVLVDAGDGAGAGDLLPGGDLAGAGLQPVRCGLLPAGDGGFLPHDPGGQLRDPGVEFPLVLVLPAVQPGAGGQAALQHLPGPGGPGLPFPAPAAAGVTRAAAVTGAGGRVSRPRGALGVQHVLDPAAELLLDPGFQLADLGVQLLPGQAGGHRRVRL